MDRNEIGAEIKKILVSIFKHDNFEIRDDLSAKDVEGWDSLTHMVIITGIEDHFHIKFKLKELNRLDNMGNLIELVSAKLAEK